MIRWWHLLPATWRQCIVAGLAGGLLAAIGMRPAGW
jgi:hypothetical protein